MSGAKFTRGLEEGRWGVVYGAAHARSYRKNSCYPLRNLASGRRTGQFLLSSAGPPLAESGTKLRYKGWAGWPNGIVVLGTNRETNRMP